MMCSVLLALALLPPGAAGSSPPDALPDGVDVPVDVVDRALSGSTAWALVPPIERDVVVGNESLPGYALELASSNGARVTFECIAGSGGLITAFKLDGVNVLLDGGAGEIRGSTFWVSPSSLWSWPPPASLDTVVFDAAVDEVAVSITLSGPVDDALGLRTVKRFSADLSRGAVTVEYTVFNEANVSKTFAPWEVTRVGPRGLTFYPTGAGQPTSWDLPLPVEQQGVLTLFQHDPDVLTGQQYKLLADGDRGWIAHQTAEGELLLVKEFQDVPFGSAAPGEAEIGIYAMADYATVEQQGAYVTVAPGSSTSWTVSWHLHGLPEDSDADDYVTVDYVEGLLQASEAWDPLENASESPPPTPPPTAWALVPPIERDVVVGNESLPGYALELASSTGARVTFECIAGSGGLVTAFRLDGVNVLLDGGAGEMRGSTFWVSPSSLWSWPPPASLDTAVFDAAVDEVAVSITLSGPVDDALGLRTVKRFSADLSRGAVTVEYTVFNEGNDSKTFAPWEVTRVGPRGLTFYPTGADQPTSGPFLPLPVEQRGGLTQFQHDPDVLTGQHYKLLADGDRGWIAHQTAEGELLFVKEFHDVPFGSAAPGEAEIGIYAMADYATVEQQGAYVTVAPGSSTIWTVSWHLRRLREDLPEELNAAERAQCTVPLCCIVLCLWRWAERVRA